MQSRRDRAKFKWWYKLATLPEDRYPKQLFNQIVGAWSMAVVLWQQYEYYYY